MRLGDGARMVEIIESSAFNKSYERQYRDPFLRKLLVLTLRVCQSQLKLLYRINARVEIVLRETMRSESRV